MSIQILPCPQGLYGVVTRHGPDSTPETLVFSKNFVHPLSGGSGVPLSLGTPLKLNEGGIVGGFELGLTDPCNPVYDGASGCTYWSQGGTILRMGSGRSSVEVVAESLDKREYPWRRCVFDFGTSFRSLTTNGNSTLYVLDGLGAAVHRARMEEGDGELRVQLATVPLTPSMCTLAYDKAGDVLLGASTTALYRLTWEETDGHSSLRVELIAGREGCWEHRDGVGEEAAFGSLYPAAMTVDERGCVYICSSGSGRLYKVDTATRRVTTLLTELQRHCGLSMSFLPSGCLAMCLCGPAARIIVVDILGLERAASSNPTTITKLSSAGSRVAETLLQQLIEGPVVAVKLAGGRTLSAHQKLLAHHSEYFKGLLSSGFAEMGAAEVELPDADPEAFAALLQSFYRGQLGVPDPLLHPAAELAGRLLMGGVLEQLTPRLLASTRPAMVVADLLWAARHSLTGLLPGLKDYFLAHAREVMKDAPGSAARLVEGSPQLAAELLEALAERG